MHQNGCFGRGCAIHREATEGGDAFANLDAEERLRDMTFDSRSCVSGPIRNSAGFAHHAFVARGGGAVH